MMMRPAPGSRGRPPSEPGVVEGAGGRTGCAHTAAALSGRGSRTTISGRGVIVC